DLAEHLGGGAPIVSPEGGVRVAAQRRDRLGDAAGVLLDLRLELDGAIGEIVALVRLVGRGGGKRHKGNERGEHAGAGSSEHGRTSIPRGAAGNPWDGICAPKRVEVVAKSGTAA